MSSQCIFNIIFITISLFITLWRFPIQKDVKIDLKKVTYDDNGNVSSEEDWKDILDRKCKKLAVEDNETIEAACLEDNITKDCGFTYGISPGVPSSLPSVIPSPLPSVLPTSS